MKRLINLFIALGILILVMAFTKPNVEEVWTLLIFFAAFFFVIFFVSLYLLTFLQFQKNPRLVATVISSSITALQVLLTFKALRPLEMLLMVAIISLGAWYFSQAKT